MSRCARDLVGVAGVRAFRRALLRVGGQRGEPLQFVLAGDKLMKSGACPAIAAELADRPASGGIDLDLQLTCRNWCSASTASRSAASDWRHAMSPWR